MTEKERLRKIHEQIEMSETHTMLRKHTGLYAYCAIALILSLLQTPNSLPRYLPRRTALLSYEHDASPPRGLTPQTN